MFGFFENKDNENQPIRCLVTTDLKVVPGHRIYNFVQTEGSFQKALPGRQVSIYCLVPKGMPLNSRVSTFN